MLEREAIDPTGRVEPVEPQGGGILEDAAGLNHLDFAALGQLFEAAGEGVDDLLLAGPQLGDIELRRLKTRRPNPAISFASPSILATCSSAFEGMQPRSRQTPPSRGSASTSVTFVPRSAARKAAA